MNETEEGVVTALLPSALVKVELDGGGQVTAHVAEELRRVSVPLKPGARVRVRRAMQDPNRASIVGVVRV